MADNGDVDPWPHPDTQWLRLPYDCGLSASRNRLITESQTPFLFIGEDDFVFTAETDLAAFLDVLSAAPDVGFVSGPLHRNARWWQGPPRRLTVEHDMAVAKDMGPCHDRLTQRGTPYVLCDFVCNFGIGRAEFFQEHPWNEALKLGEHMDYFCRVKHAGRWKIAHTPACTAIHDVAHRADEYRKLRNRAKDYNHAPQRYWGKVFSQ